MREKVEKYTTLHAAASKNYTELREECQGYYDNLQVNFGYIFVNIVTVLNKNNQI